MSLPKRITPSPLREAVVELRFESILPADAVFGIVYNALSESYPTLEKLPILQIPEAIRNKDENLIFQPHYKLKRENFIAQVGPRVFALSMTPPFTRWSEYLPELLTVFDKVGKANVIADVSRFGLRYINNFDEPILEKLNVELKIVDRGVQDDEIYIRNISASGNFNVLLQIVNCSDNLLAKNANAETVSAIDTDVSLEGEKLDFFADKEGLLTDAHNIQKETFFGLLKKSFLQSMDPEY